MPKLSPCLKNQCRPISTGTPATIVDAGFWKSLVPKPLRRENRKRTAKKTKDWNPMTFYIVMFLFIGSMSIQMIALRNQTNRYIRQSSVRIGLLKEIIQRIQNGEDVDVDKILGAGDAQKEADWEEGILVTLLFCRAWLMYQKQCYWQSSKTTPPPNQLRKQRKRQVVKNRAKRWSRTKL